MLIVPTSDEPRCWRQCSSPCSFLGVPGSSWRWVNHELDRQSTLFLHHHKLATWPFRRVLPKGALHPAHFWVFSRRYGGQLNVSLETFVTFILPRNSLSNTKYTLNVRGLAKLQPAVSQPPVEVWHILSPCAHISIGPFHISSTC